MVEGAQTVAQFDGYNEKGIPSVAVVVQWSNKLASVAALIKNPTNNSVKIDLGPPDLPVSQQIANNNQRNPSWLSSANGVRVWVDENGGPVILAFGVAPQTNVSSIDRDRARLAAEGAIAEFVAENITAEDILNTGNAYQEMTPEIRNNLVETEYRRTIKSNAANLTLSGIVQVASWRGDDEIGRAPMQVVVLQWTPSSAAAARDLQKQMQQENLRPNLPTPQTGGGAGREGVTANPNRF